jgi:hypothetical protein
MIRHLIRPFLTVLLIAIAVSSGAQVNIVFNAAVMGKDLRGLSGVQIINTSTNSYTGTLEIEVKNIAQSAAVVKMVVHPVTISAGNNIIPYTKFSGAAVTYSNTAAGNYTRQTGQLPEGELEYCFKLTAAAKDNTPEIFENCFLGTNIISGPLELIMPGNGDSFCEKRPRFNWQPPMPLQAGTTFTIRLTEKKQGQSAAEALLLSVPVFYQARLNAYIFPFPSNIPDLKEGHQYVWQVTAENKGKQTLSEIWEFSIQCEKTQTTDKSFRELKAEDDGGFLSTGPSLRFAVYNLYTPGNLQYSIQDLNNPDKKSKGLPVLELQKGANNILIDLKKIPGMVDGNEYSLVVILPDGKKVSLRFKYQEDDE